MLIIRPIFLLLVHVYIYCFYRYLTYLNTNTDKPTMKKMTILCSAFVLVAMSKTGCKKYYGHFENVFGICRTKVNSMYMSLKSTYMIRLGLVFQLKLLWFLLLFKNQNTLLGIARTIDYENRHYARTPYLNNLSYTFCFGNKSRIYIMS